MNSNAVWFPKPKQHCFATASALVAGLRQRALAVQLDREHNASGRHLPQETGKKPHIWSATAHLSQQYIPDHNLPWPKEQVGEEYNIGLSDLTNKNLGHSIQFKFR